MKIDIQNTNKIRDEFSQTSDESTDEEESSSKDETVDETSAKDTREVGVDTKTSTSEIRPLSRSILNRMTSAHIRQFVSPDFKQIAAFNSPSIAFSRIGKTIKKLDNVPGNEADKAPTSNETDLNTVEKNVAETSRHSKDYVKSSANKSKDKKKIRKSVLDRLRCPTLSFILKTQRKVAIEDTNKRKTIDLLTPIVLPCERYNRRNNIKDVKTNL